MTLQNHLSIKTHAMQEPLNWFAKQIVLPGSYMRQMLKCYIHMTNAICYMIYDKWQMLYIHIYIFFMFVHIAFPFMLMVYKWFIHNVFNQYFTGVEFHCSLESQVFMVNFLCLLAKLKLSVYIFLVQYSCKVVQGKPQKLGNGIVWNKKGVIWRIL